jgi:hypothetical protein
MAKKRNPPRKTAKPTSIRPKPPNQPTIEARLDILYRQVREILDSARSRAWQAFKTAMVESRCWEVGRVMVEEEQARSTREPRPADQLAAL